VILLSVLTSAHLKDNSASIGTILGYVFYWIFLMGVLLYLKWKEGRLVVCGTGSAAYRRRMTERSLQSSHPVGFESASTPSDESEEKDIGAK
jgi:high-affinity iron transporter